jgi:hypothetical protein
MAYTKFPLLYTMEFMNLLLFLFKELLSLFIYILILGPKLPENGVLILFLILLHRFL